MLRWVDLSWSNSSTKCSLTAQCFCSICQNSSANWNNGHIFTSYKQIYFPFYIKKTVSPYTHGAKRNNSYYMHQYKSRESHSENTTTTHPAPQARYREPILVETRSQALCMSAAPDQCESNTLVSEQLYSQSVWGFFLIIKKKKKLSVLTGSGRAGWVASDAPHHLPSCRHPV